MSMEASGSLAGTLVFSKWKGRPYVRGLVMPSNPKSGKQTGMRSMFKFLSQEWAGLAVAHGSSWLALAAAGNYSTFNAYMSTNQTAWRSFVTPSQAYPAAQTSGAPSALTAVATAGIRQITLEMTHGATPADWGVAIFRQLGGAPTPSLDNCVAIIPVDASGDATYIDTPLEAGTWHYKLIGFNDDGVQGAASIDYSAIVA